MQNFDWMTKIQEAIEELGKTYDLGKEEVTFYFHPMYRVYLTKSSYSSIPKVFGKSKLGRWKRYGRKVRKGNAFPKSFRARLPTDSIIFVRPEKLGLIVLSETKDVGLKVFFNEYYTPLLDKEIEALNSIQHLDFAPKIMGHGKTKGSGYWSLTNFCANSDSLGLFFDPEDFLLHNFTQLIIPAMTGYYQATSPQIEQISAWTKRAKERLNAHPSREIFLKLVAEIENEANKFTSFELVSSNVHFDLHAGNILMNEGKISLIDWEGGFRGLIYIDFFDFTRRYLNTHKVTKFFFKRFLRGKSSYPSVLSPSFEVFRNWSKNTFSANIPIGSERLMVLIYVLERSMILFEDRNLDRSQDKRAFEYMVLKEVL